MNKPKYRIGDYVWFMLDDKVREGVICEIREEIFHSQRMPSAKRHCFEYWISYENGLSTIHSTQRIQNLNKIFPSKQELINSL